MKSVATRFNTRSAEESLENIRKIISTQEATIEKLRATIEEMKQKTYKDDVIKSLKEERDRAVRDMLRGFPISEEEGNRINSWVEKHEKEKHPQPEGMHRPRGGAIGGCYRYNFIPTGIGTFGTIYCNCGEEFTFQEAV